MFLEMLHYMYLILRRLSRSAAVAAGIPGNLLGLGTVLEPCFRNLVVQGMYRTSLNGIPTLYFFQCAAFSHTLPTIQYICKFGSPQATLILTLSIESSRVCTTNQAPFQLFSQDGETELQPLSSPTSVPRKKTVFRGLAPRAEYTVRVCTVLNGRTVAKRTEAVPATGCGGEDPE